MCLKIERVSLFMPVQVLAMILKERLRSIMQSLLRSAGFMNYQKEYG